MGKKSREMVGNAAKEIIDLLNQALAAEILAAYRYLYLSKWASGIASPEIAERFEEMSKDEWGHAAAFMGRIIQLEGKPLSNLRDLEKRAYMKYHEPPDRRSDLQAMIRDSLEEERQAIEFYNALAEKVQHEDPVTYMLAATILADEAKDEEDLESLLE